mgnify:CR=1 FL=1
MSKTLITTAAALVLIGGHIAFAQTTATGTTGAAATSCRRRRGRSGTGRNAPESGTTGRAKSPAQVRSAIRHFRTGPTR